MPDLAINCVQCSLAFVFTEKEQEVFYQRNMSPSHRCPACRPQRKKDFVPSEQIKHEIICDRCGKLDRVSFAPKFGRSVYCGDCHSASRVRKRVAVSR